MLLAPLPLAFALPLQALTGMPIGATQLALNCAMIGWSVSTFGYVASLLAPHAASVPVVY